MSDSEYSDEPEEVQAATPPLAKKMAPSGTAAARSGGSGLMVGVGVAAAVAVVGAVGLKLFWGKSNEARPGRAANASTKTNKTRGSPAKKTVQRRAAAVSPRANAAAATAPAPSSSTSAASTSDESATQVRSPLRSAAPVLPKRPTPKPKAATTAPAAAATEEPAATSAATAATAKASAEAHAARQAADREAAEAAAAAAKQKAAAEAAAEKKAAAEAAAKDKAAKERAAAEAAAKEKAAAEQAAKDKAAKDKAATEVAAKEKAVAEAAAKEKTEKQQAEADKDAADAAASQKAAATAATAAAAATAASVGGVVAAAAGQPSSTKEPSPAAAKQQQPAKQQPAAKAAGAAKQDSAAKEQERPAKEQPAARKPAPAKEQSAAKQQPAAKEQPAAKQQPAAEEQAGADGEAEADAAEAPAVVHVMPRSSDIAGLLVSLDVGDAAEEGAAEEKIERLADIPCPPLSFEGVDAEGDLNEIEQKARQMSLHAHKLVKENNNIVHGTREQKAALDFLLAPENAGKARPHLVAACAFALGDMLLAQQKVDETKAALAIAYQTSTHIEDKGPQVKALMNYAYILKSKKMTASARDAYEEALALARQQHGPLHGMVEKVKYELTAFLGGSGREAEAANLLIASAAELLTEAERLAAEEEENGGKDEAQQGGEAADEAAAPPPGAAEAANGAAEGDAADPGTGFEHLADEQAAAAAAAARGEEEEGEELTPVQQAQHFAMRNLMNAAGVLDGLQQYERSEALLAKALDIAVATWGTGTVQQLNVMYALAQHFRRRGQLQESIDYHEGVLAIMDESIQVYSPELLQNRISILRDTAVLLDQTDQVETAIDYATGALVNAQTLAGIVQGQQRSVNHPMLEPFYRLLADLKLKFGDEVGAAEARRQANGTRLTKRIAQNNTKQQRAQKGGTGSKRAAASGTGSGSTSTRTPNTGASTARAGGRRV